VQVDHSPEKRTLRIGTRIAAQHPRSIHRIWKLFRELGEIPSVSGKQNRKHDLHFIIVWSLLVDTTWDTTNSQQLMRHYKFYVPFNCTE
jgi:hypothetical protein